jgi:hypothetical protein
MSDDMLTVLTRARQSFGELTSLAVESVSRIESTDDGWQASFEVVELERVPRIADLLASYEVEIDQSGILRSWRRTRRYVRKQPEEV